MKIEFLLYLLATNYNLLNRGVLMKIIYVFLLLLLQSVAFPQAFQWEWQNTKPCGNDFYDIVPLTATRVLAFGGASAVLISTDNGESWDLSYADNSRFDIQNSYFLNTTTGFICGTGGSIMKTTDGGTSWVPQNSGSTNALYDIEFLNADTGIAVGSAGTVLRTFNGGDTWTATSFGTSTHYKVSLINSTTILIGSSSSTTGRLLKSTDFGATWVSANPTGLTSTVYSICIKDASTFFLGAGVDGIMMTTDTGTTWSIKHAVANSIFDIKFINSTTGFASDSKGNIYSSTNGGLNWTSSPSGSPKGLRAVGFNSSASFVTGNSGNLFKTTDSGLTWSAKHTSITQEYLRRMIFKTSTDGWICGGSSTAADSIGFILQTTDGGNNWTKLPYNFKNQVYSFSMPTSDIWYAGRGANKFYKTTDAGATFTEITTPITSATHTFWFTGFYNDQIGVTGGASGKVIKTTNGGTSWTDISTAAGFGTNAVYEIAYIDSNIFYLSGGGGRLAKTTDGGTTFTAMTTQIAGTFFTVKFKNANFGIVAGSSLGASRTTDGGASWTIATLPSNLAASTSIWSIAYNDSNYIWLSSINGDILYSTDGGLNFVASKKPTSNTMDAMAVVGNKLWVAGTGGAIVKGYSSPYLPVELTSFTAEAKAQSVLLKWTTATETNNKGFDIEKQNTTGVWSKIGFVKGKGSSVEKMSYNFTDMNPIQNNFYRLKQIDFDGTYKYSNIAEVNFGTPVKFELSQNYPNPFNPNTSIRFSIPLKSNVEVKIYNVLGKEIATIVNGVREAGAYSVDFNASMLASGVYFYKISAGQYNSVKKMMLLK